MIITLEENNMSKYFIERVNRDNNGKGHACGIVGGTVCTSIQYRKDNEPSKWLELDDVNGILSFYLSDKDLFEYHVNFDMIDNDVEIERINKDLISEYEGISLSDCYEGIFDQLYGDQKDNPAAQLLKYLIYVSTCSDEELMNFIESGTNRFLDKIDIPVSETEQQYVDGK